MSRARRSRCRGERGTSLIIAMGFLGLLSVAVVSLLILTMANTKTTQTVRSVSGKTFAADAGVDVGIHLLRGNTSYCPDPASGTQSLPTQTVNGATITITCQALSGGVGGSALSPTPYALIVTGYPPKPGASAPKLKELFRKEGSAGSTGTVSIGGGPSFNAGKFYDKFTDNKPVIQFQGDLDQWNSTTGQDPGPHCTDSKTQAASSGNPAVTGTWTCRNQNQYPVPDPNPNLIVPTAMAPAPIVQGNCTIVFPGRYTSKPVDFDEKDHYYFASGVYYFDDVGEMKMEAASMFGGEPASGESRAFSGITPCATDAIANSLRPGSATGKGVLFIMGKKSSWNIHDHVETRIELFSRVPANPAIEPPAGISIYAPRVDGANWLANEAGEIIKGDGPLPQVVIHGLVYAPGSDTDQLRVLANPAAGGLALFSGGLVVSRFEAKFDGNSVFGKLIQRGDGVAAATDRVITVTATATPPDGGAPTTVQAIIEVPTAGTPPTIRSWRKV